MSARALQRLQQVNPLVRGRLLSTAARRSSVQLPTTPAAATVNRTLLQWRLQQAQLPRMLGAQAAAAPREDPYSPCQGPDQLAPAASHKCWEASAAVQLQMTETGPAAEPPLSVYTVLSRVAQHHPQQPALMVNRGGEWLTWTYQDYFEQSVAVAKAFIKLGLERHHGVAIMGFNCPEWFIANIGCIFAGGISAGIYTNNAPDSCLHVAEDSRAQVLVLEDSAAVDKLLSVKEHLTHVKAIVQWSGTPSAPGVMTWEDLLALGRLQSDDAVDQRLAQQAVNQCCALIYTSGTTGPPKGVMCSQDNMVWCSAEYAKYFDLNTCGESVVSYLPLNHIAGQMTDIYVSMACASTVYFARPDALKGSLIHTLRDVQPTGFLTVPRILEKMQEQMEMAFGNAGGAKQSALRWARAAACNHYQAIIDGREPSVAEQLNYKLAKKLVLDKIKAAIGLSNNQHLVSGSAPVSDELVAFFHSIDLHVSNAYAMSETHSNGTMCNIRDGTFKWGSMGKPVYFANIEIKHSAQTSGIIEGEGEISFKGRNVFMGYLNSPEKTNETILDDGWMLTGDLGWRDSEGFMYMSGRAKELIITAGGENIAPLPIEEAVKRELPILSSAMVVGDTRKYLGILLTIKCARDLETGAALDNVLPCVVPWLRARDCHATTVTGIKDHLTDHPYGLLAEGIQQAMDRYNDRHAVSTVHQIRRWAVLPQDFSPTTGELSVTLKLKRSFVANMYAPLIETLYEQR